MLKKITQLLLRYYQYGKQYPWLKIILLLILMFLLLKMDVLQWLSMNLKLHFCNSDGIPRLRSRSFVWQVSGSWKYSIIEGCILSCQIICILKVLRHNSITTMLSMITKIWLKNNTLVQTGDQAGWSKKLVVDHNVFDVNTTVNFKGF